MPLGEINACYFRRADIIILTMSDYKYRQLIFLSGRHNIIDNNSRLNLYGIFIFNLMI